jgi:MFS family permease
MDERSRPTAGTGPSRDVPDAVPPHPADRPESRWFFVLFTTSMLLQAVTGVVRPMASYRALEIGVEPGLLGVLAASYALAPLVFALAIGRRMDRSAEVRFVLLGAGAMVAASVGLAASSSIPLILICLALSGLSHLVAIIALQTLIATRSRDHSLDRRYGHLGFVASLGQLIGPAAGGLIAGTASVDGTTRALLFSALLASCALPLAWWIGRRDPGHLVPRPMAGAPRPSLAGILRTPGMIPAMLASLTVLSAVDIIVVYLPALGQERGIGVAVVGTLLAVRAGASMASRLALGWLVDRAGRERLLITSMLLAALATVCLPLVPLPAMFVAMTLSGLGHGIGQPLTLAWVAAGATPGMRATAISVRLMGNRLGQVVVPLLAGSVAAFAGTAGVLAVAGITVGASAFAVGGRMRRRDGDR